MAKIYGSTTATPLNPDMFGGGGEGGIVNQIYNPTSPYAQSGIAVAKAVATKMDKFGTVTEIERGKKVILDEEPISGDNAVLFQSKGGQTQLKFTDSGEAYFKVANCIIKKEITGGDYWDLCNCGFRNVRDPEEDTDVANVGYVKRLCIPERVTNVFDIYMELENNKEYILPNKVSNLEFGYPNGADIICSVTFTTATEGDINITFPTGTKFIGGRPTFGKGETWELNIKNGVVVGGKVE